MIKQVSCQKISASYLKVVGRSHFVSSDKVYLSHIFFLINVFQSCHGKKGKV